MKCLYCDAIDTLTKYEKGKYIKICVVCDREKNGVVPPNTETEND